MNALGGPFKNTSAICAGTSSTPLPLLQKGSIGSGYGTTKQVPQVPTLQVKPEVLAAAAKPTGRANPRMPARTTGGARSGAAIPARAAATVAPSIPSILQLSPEILQTMAATLAALATASNAVVGGGGKVLQRVGGPGRIVKLNSQGNQKKNGSVIARGILAPRQGGKGRGTGGGTNGKSGKWGKDVSKMDLDFELEQYVKERNLAKGPISAAKKNQNHDVADDLDAELERYAEERRRLKGTGDAGEANEAMETF